MIQAETFRLAIDVGGTFTDTVLVDVANHVVASAKTATTPRDPTIGALEGARAVLKKTEVQAGQVTGVIHGTTLATNALIERRGAKVVTITTDGFRDILEIGYERRYSQYAINLEKPDLIVSRQHAFTTPGRIDAKGAERAPLDLTAVPALMASIDAAEAEAVAICLLHAYANPAHESTLRDALAAERPDLHISVSHEVSPEAREFDRLCTTICNAYVQPLMATYLPTFEQFFRNAGLTCPILMMTASGGMTTLETAARLPIRLVESGPAGGAILAARIAEQTQEPHVLSFDMGGTTAKLCLIDNYRPQTARRFEIARAERFIKGSGMPVRIPVIEMIEIGAGGGSIASVDRMGRVLVGPHSAGADPGPAGFDKGGNKPTVTDADIVSGYIDKARFAEGRLHLATDKSADALGRDIAEPLQCTIPDAALAVSEIVDESMAAAGRMHAVESGQDLSARVMIAFGGNGPLHASRVARRAGVSRIVIPKDPGVGSAVGFLWAPVSFEVVRSNYTFLETLDVLRLNTFLAECSEEARTVVRAGAPDGELTERRVAFMRYHGQGHEIEITLPSRELTQADVPDLQSAFETEYARQFSRSVPGMKIEVLNWGLTVSSQPALSAPPTGAQTSAPQPVGAPTDIMCDVTGQHRTALVFDRSDVPPGATIPGPALICEAQTTTLVSADFEACVDNSGNIWLTRQKETPA